MTKLRDRLAKALSWAPRCDDALDLGCGGGIFADRLRSKVKHVRGADVLEHQISAGRDTYPEIELAVAPGESLPYADDLFDLVTCLDTLEHVEDEAATIAEIRRVLKPGGTLIISVPHRGLFGWLDPDNLIFFPLSRLRRKLFTKKTDIYGIRHHKHYSMRELEEMLVGFEPVRAYRGGCLVFPLVTIFAKILDTIADYTWSGLRTMFKPLHWLCDVLIDLDYRIPSGPLAYCLMLEMRKERDDE